jgi:hypothetical protein
MFESSGNIHFTKGPRSLSRTLNNVTNPLFAKRGFVGTKLITDWHLIVGDSVSKHSSPRKLVFAKDKKTEGILHVDVFDSGMAMELTYTEPVILEKIATYFGYRAIARIKITQKLAVRKEIEQAPPKRKLPEDKLQDLRDKLADVDDEELKAALERFGVNVMGE